MHVPSQPLDAITAFTVPNPDYPSQSRRFFQVWLLVRLPRRADHSVYFGPAQYYCANPFVGGGWTHGGSGDSCINSQTGTMSGCEIIGNSGFGTSGVFGGGQIGYLRPIDINLGPGIPLMLGIEADIQGSGIHGSQSVAGPFQLVDFPEPARHAASQRTKASIGSAPCGPRSACQ